MNLEKYLRIGAFSPETVLPGSAATCRPNPFATTYATRIGDSPLVLVLLPGLAEGEHAVLELPDVETQPQTAVWKPSAQAYELLPMHSLHLR
jgi:hypothetical protein